MILSSPNPNKWSGYIGRVTDLIEQKITDKDSENTEVYLCGGRKMIEDCKQILEEKKFPDARTFPQITMDGEYIGGFTELDAHLG